METINTQEKISEACKKIESLLLAKNTAYGDSALNPLRIFSKSKNTAQIKTRIDDKLSRIARGWNTGIVPEDTLLDLIGYLVLLYIAEKAWEE